MYGQKNPRIVMAAIEDILVIMSEPKLVNNSAQFAFQSDSLEKAKLKARSSPGVKNILNRNFRF